uniref:Uncharacterized protein n=1 Tax=Branchiostoma floridae TaxID=7739 RepID=C3YCS2_BRAFL|eukprot:XP_002605863.1 hypothetical protein BRAFLDRAFT_90818 [Branchiostoma floridae]
MIARPLHVFCPGFRTPIACPIIWSVMDIQTVSYKKTRRDVVMTLDKTVMTYQQQNLREVKIRQEDLREVKIRQDDLREVKIRQDDLRMLRSQAKKQQPVKNQVKRQQVVKKESENQRMVKNLPMAMDQLLIQPGLKNEKLQLPMREAMGPRTGPCFGWQLAHL